MILLFNFIWQINPVLLPFYSLNADFEKLSFEKLDFGETAVLDKFYNADAAVVDMSTHAWQSALFYLIGIRESMGMDDNIVMLHDKEPETTSSVKVGQSLTRSITTQNDLMSLTRSITTQNGLMSLTRPITTQKAECL